MDKIAAKNMKYLVKKGITRFEFQKYLMDSIPCGETVIEDVMKDGTSYQVNAPRALMICHYKGLLMGLSLAQRL